MQNYPGQPGRRTPRRRRAPSPAAQRQGNTPASRRARPKILARQQRPSVFSRPAHGVANVGTGPQRRQRRQPRPTRQQAKRTFSPGLGQLPLSKIRAQSQRAARKTVRDLLDLPGAPKAPERPTLSHYSPRQEIALTRARGKYQASSYRFATSGGAPRGTGTYRATRSEGERHLQGAFDTPQERTHFARQGQELLAGLRTLAHKTGYSSTASMIAARPTVSDAHIHHSGPGKFFTAAADLTGIAGGRIPQTKEGRGLLSAPLQLGRAFVEDPGKTTSASLRTAKESITGIPQAAKMLVENPGDALHQIGQDYERRYGPLLTGDSKTFRQRVKQDYGITPYAIDAAAVAGGAGRLAGLAARSETAGRLIAAAEKARPPVGGRIVRASRAVHEASREDVPRPKVRYSGGETGVAKQPVSKNLFVAGTQRIVDRRRAAKFQREAEHAGLQQTPEGKLVPIEGAPQRPLSTGKGRFGALRPGPGEVLPYYSAREAPVLHRFMGRTERTLGHRKSMERLRLLSHGGEVEKRARKALKSLDGNEKGALKYVMQLGLDPENKGAAVKALAALRDIHVAGRAQELNAPRLEPDEIPLVDKIIAEPDKYLTPKVRQVANNLRALEHHEAAKDPALATEQAATRRTLPQSMVLEQMGHDVRRRPNVEELHGRLRKIGEKIGRRNVGKEQSFYRLRETQVARDAAKSSVEAEKAQIKEGQQLLQRHGNEVPHEVRAQLEKHLADSTKRLDMKQRELADAENAVAASERDMAPRGPDVVGEFGGLAELPPEHRLGAVRQMEKKLRTEKGKRAREVSTAERQAAVMAERVRNAEKGSAAAAPWERAPEAADQLRQGLTEARNNVLRKRAAHDDARINHAVAAHLKGELKTRPGRYEDFASFDKRVRDAAEKAGLEAPAYFESSGGVELRRSLKAIGTGFRGAAGTKAYTGARFLAGRESNDPEIIVNGLLRNAKRRFSWRFTVNTIDQSAFEWSRGPSGAGLTASEIRRELKRNQINPDDVELVNPRILHDRELQDAGVQRGKVEDPSVDASPTGGLHPEDMAVVHQTLRDARESKAILSEATDVRAGETRGVAMNRYLVVPRRDFEELSQATQPSGFAGRAFDILWKQKPARILLGLANTSWLSFQFLANGFVSGLAGARNPFDYVAAQRWWKGLTPEQKLAIEPELGITHQHHPIAEETQLGAATNNRFINAWRAFKQTKVMRTAHKGNPLDLMFRADEAQNNFFRRTVFYNQAKRAAYRRMGRTWKQLNGDHDRLTKILDMRDPKRRMQAIIDNADEFQKAAEHTREFLGDYLTYSAKERTQIARPIMFYGYLRFSLRFTFWTMPVKHPIMTAILSDLGRMGSQEVKRLLGLPADRTGYRNEDVPASMLAQAYFGTARGIQNQLPGSGSINFGRMNPFLNAVSQAERPEQLLGLFSPLAQAEFDQIFQRSTFTGRTWRIMGLPTPSETERPKDYFGDPSPLAAFADQFNFSIPGLTKGSPRGRIFERQLLSLMAPYQMLSDTGLKAGPVNIKPLAPSSSDDALLWAQHPIQYRSPEAQQGTARARKLKQQQAGLPALARRALPLLSLIHGIGPQPTAAPIVLKRELEKEKAARKRARNRQGSPAPGNWLHQGGGGPIG